MFQKKTFYRSISLLSSRSFGLRVESKSFTISKVALEVGLLDLYQTISKLTVYQFCRSLSRWDGGWWTWIGAKRSEFLQHSNRFGSGAFMVLRYYKFNVLYQSSIFLKNLTTLVPRTTHQGCTLPAKITSHRLFPAYRNSALSKRRPRHAWG